MKGISPLNCLNKHVTVSKMAHGRKIIQNFVLASVSITYQISMTITKE